MAFQFPQAAPYLAATTHAVLFSSPAVPSCSFINFQRKTGMGDCSNSQEQQQNIFPVSTTTGISKRQIPLTASSHALHLPVSCQSVFPTVRVICTRGSRRAPTFLIKMTGNLVYTGAGVPAARTAPGKCRNSQPWLSACQKYHNFQQRKIKGATPAAPAGSTQTLFPVPPFQGRDPLFLVPGWPPNVSSSL